MKMLPRKPDAQAKGGKREYLLLVTSFSCLFNNILHVITSHVSFLHPIKLARCQDARTCRWSSGNGCVRNGGGGPPPAPVRDDCSNRGRKSCKNKRGCEWKRNSCRRKNGSFEDSDEEHVAADYFESNSADQFEEE